MAEKLELRHPWLVAVWPGMGNVALNAGIYLLSKLHMELIAVLESGDLFDVDHVVVQGGIVQMAQQPRNRFFVWTDPHKKHDLIVFLGEAQPPIGKQPFCRQLIKFVRELGVERVFTFAAMATQMHPEHPSRVFVAATDQEILDELRTLELEVLEDGQISGLNGILLGAAAASDLPGACFLGEMPHIFSQIAFPKASLAILEIFKRLTGIEIDTDELAGQARLMDEKLGELLAEVEKTMERGEAEEEPEFGAELAEEETPSAADRQRIETLFERAAKNRAKAFELKQELDQLGVFKDYEDRFLDLFKKS